MHEHKCAAANMGLKKGTIIDRVLQWREVQDALPWWVILMLGGGFALAEGCRDSGLSRDLGAALAPALRGCSGPVVAFVLSVVVAALTEVASNVATASIFLPIVGSLAVRTGRHPLYFMVPVALACSFAFCLCSSTSFL